MSEATPVTKHDPEDVPRERLPVRPSAVEESEMDITPMIDCTFLLLIFFIVCSKIDQKNPITMPTAKYGTAVAASDSVILTITKGDGINCNVYKGDGAEAANLISGADATVQEDEIVRYVEASMRSENPKHHVLIKAERLVKHREVARIAKAAARVSETQEFHIGVMEIGRGEK